MPKKNKTACKRRKCQRSRSQRRTRTIRRGGWPSCWSSCWPSRSNRVAPTPSPTQLPQYNSTIASVAREAQDMVHNSVTTRKATQDQANLDRRTKHAEDEAERLKQQALRTIALRKLNEAERIQYAAQRAVARATRETKRAEYDIAAAQKKLDAAVRDVPSHMGAVARSHRQSPPGSD